MRLPLASFALKCASARPREKKSFRPGVQEGRPPPKELPALVDSIRNQIGMEQAVQFQQDATAALTGLVQSLQGTKTSLEQGLGVVTGQGQMAPGLDAAMGGTPPTGAEAPVAAAPGQEVDLSLDANLEEPEAEPAGGRLGRERR